MANTAHPGFLPAAKGGLTVELVRDLVLSNNTGRICKGDCLQASSSGDVFLASSGTVGMYSVSMGASFIVSGERLERMALPASTTYTGTAVNNNRASFVYAVEDVVNTRFRCSIDTAVLETDRLNCFPVTLTAGTADFSKQEATSTGQGVTATIPWRFEDFIIDDPTVDPTAAHAHVLMRLNAGDGRNPALELSGTLGL